MDDKTFLKAVKTIVVNNSVKIADDVHSHTKDIRKDRFIGLLMVVDLCIFENHLLSLLKNLNFCSIQFKELINICKENFESTIKKCEQEILKLELKEKINAN